MAANVGSLAGAFRRIVSSRHSARRYSPEQVSLDVIKDCLSMAQRAPSSFNCQPYTAVVVTDDKIKQKLAKAMLGENGIRVLEAPVTVVFAADLQSAKLSPKVVALAEKSGAPAGFLKKLPMFISLMGGGVEVPDKVGGLVRAALQTTRDTAMCAASMMGVKDLPHPLNHPEAWAYKNTMPAAMTYMHAAAAYGLDTTPMEGYQGDNVRSALGIPERYSVPLVVSTGYAASQPSVASRSGRFPASEVFFQNQFGVPMEGEFPRFDLDNQPPEETPSGH